MKYICLLLLLVGMSLGGLCQNLDSLARAVEAMPNDTVKVIQCISLGGKYTNNRSDNAAARPLYETALTLAEKLNFARGIAESTRSLAYIHQSLGEYKVAIKYNQRTIDFIDSQGFPIKK